MRRFTHRLTAKARPSQIRTRRTRRQKQPQPESDEEDGVDSFDSTRRYDIGDMTKEKGNVLEWVHANRADVATKVWYFKNIVYANNDAIVPYYRTSFVDSRIIS
jgi:hypothetical protein